jgi:hypothetical protein
MLAVKATYDNGMVKWKRKPKFGGRHNLIVVFEDLGNPVHIKITPKVTDQSDRQDTLSTTAMPILPELRGYVPPGWKDAVYGE